MIIVSYTRKNSEEVRERSFSDRYSYEMFIDDSTIKVLDVEFTHPHNQKWQRIDD